MANGEPVSKVQLSLIRRKIMSDLQLQNLSNFKTTNSLTADETSHILGGFSSARLDFLQSLSFADDVTFEDLQDIEASAPNQLNSRKSKFSGRKKGRKGNLNAGNGQASNVIIGTPGDDILIGN